VRTVRRAAQPTGEHGMTEAGYKRVFLIGALWNLVGGTFIILATGWIFRTAKLAPPAPSLYYDSWIALFMTFGIGYYLVYRDLYRNRDIALLGAIGKIAFATVFLWSFAAHPGEAPLFFLVPVVGDLIFAALFLMFYGFSAHKAKE
jgi:hypothetical protein